MTDEMLLGDEQRLIATHAPLGLESTLTDAILAYQDYMTETGFSLHTVKAFSGDLRLLQSYHGTDTLVHRLGTHELNQFLYWLQYERRGVSCSSKSYARRVTTLKSFFGWLTSIKILSFDPATALIHPRVTTPLPIILSNDEVDHLLNVTSAYATDDKRPDARPHLLVQVLLQTGIKKAECMRLMKEDFEDSNPKKPSVLIRYDNPRLMHKERRLEVSPDLMKTLDDYLDTYQPTEHIFDCTPRNLEYVLTDMAQEAELSNGASFESLRWTCAFRDFRDGVPHDQLRDKLGLSKVTWRETLQKLEKLAAQEEV